ncbi:MAG: hypothetical protein AAFY71_00815 [Bacteroidota bacterium]
MSKVKFPLMAVSLLYLLLPLGLFLIFWVKWWIGLPLFISVCWALWATMPAYDVSVYRVREILLLLGIAIALGLLSGMGGFFPQQDDYIKHNLLWQDLVSLDWPIFYTHEAPLNYYVGYYLVPAFLSKMLGMASLAWSTLLWGSLGIWLISLWVWNYAGNLRWLGLAIFFLFAGQDFLWGILVHLRYMLMIGEWPPLLLAEMGLPQEFGLAHKIQGHFSHLLWAPQHFVGGALATFLFISALERGVQISFYLGIIGLSLLWSPLISIGLLPFFLLENRRGVWTAKTRKLELLPVMALILVLGSYYLAHQPLETKAFIWQAQPFIKWVPFFLFFVLMKFLPLAGLLTLNLKQHPDNFHRKVLFVSTGFLILLMTIYLGYANDGYMRISFPAWLALSMLLLVALQKGHTKGYLRTGLWLWVGGAAIVPLFLIGQQVVTFTEGKSVYPNTLAHPEKTLFLIDEVYQEQDIYMGTSIQSQYLGERESIFYQFLSPAPDSSQSNKTHNSKID